jgi:hypothetical protein
MPNWVSNTIKYQRALDALRKTGQAVTEEAVKTLYIKYGGLVLEEGDAPEEQTEEDTKPRGRRRA